MADAELKLKGLFDSKESWDNFESMQNTFTFQTSPISEYVFAHWKEDAFYGYQFLNGVHPSVIKRCSWLPSNFPVSEEMVQPLLGSGTSLQQEMEKGNIFLCDYKIMDNIPAPVMDGKPLPFTAALCLLHVDTAGELKPIAIQLGQRPSEKCPIFLPSDAELDWLLAKMFVKNADGIFHQMASHLQNTHLLCEPFAVATMRHFPAVHPLYKLLMPHFRYNLQINIVGRVILLGPEGIASLTSLGTAGVVELMSRELAQTTYSSLCLPENIADRGLENIPNFYYRDDGLKLWKAINSYVRAMVELFYPADDQVSGDAELQRWIHDIFTKGFLGNGLSGIPESLKTVQEVVKFVTMVIFTASAQHAAVNNGQFDYNSCYPNTPLMLRGAPPTAKGQVTMETILGALPSIGTTVQSMSVAVILHKKHADSVKHIIENFQKELSSIDESINRRNAVVVLLNTHINNNNNNRSRLVDELSTPAG
ncbi:hypothetical protein CRUP_031569 [Coryphaenoides rupestris]|nr:hypothetical protein CRUP_031569 [Coryphaenoides rupestris]